MAEQTLGRVMIFAAIVLFLSLLTWLFQGALERQENPNYNPQTQSSATMDEVVLHRNRSAHYITTGRINQHSVRFLVDTGATDIALSESIAKKMNLPLGASVMLSTANGVTQGYRTVLDRVAVGNIELENIPAVITRGIDDNVVLLGMSYLKQLELIQRDGMLILRHYH